MAQLLPFVPPGGDYSRTDFGDVVLAAQASEMSLIDFAFKTTLPISIAAIIGMAIAHFFWQRYLDKKSTSLMKC